MNKKIIVSLSVIGVVAAIAIGGTIAYFSDTETSAGNTFTAGKVDLKVDSYGASYNGVDLTNTNWDARNLTYEKFFEFDDVKPGDYGYRNISLHADGNKAWACAIIHNKSDDENTPIDPEIVAGDNLLDGVPNGELSKNINIFAWQDNNSNGKYDPNPNPAYAEPVLFNTDSFFDVNYFHIADADSGTPPLEPYGPAATRHIVIAWCAGTQTVNPVTGAITCDGAGMNDQSQTDIFTADISLYAEQWRNNPNFDCANVIIPTPIP